MKKLVVLIVEERPKMQYLVASEYGHEVIILTAPNVRHALKMINLCPVDILIIDDEVQYPGSLDFMKESARRKDNLETVRNGSVSDLATDKFCNALKMNVHVPESLTVFALAEAC